MATPAGFLPSKNYPGSSGYGVRANGTFGAITPTNNAKALPDYPEYPTYDPQSGRVVSNKTGKPWTGTWSGTGQHYENGMPVATPPVNPAGVNPPAPTGDPTKDYAAVNIEKSPGMGQAVQAMLDQFKKTAADSLKDFADYKNEFTQDLATARTAASAATNIQPTVQALTEAQGSYAQRLAEAQKQYADTMAATAAAQRGIVQDAQDALPGYDAAIDAVRRQEMAALGPYMAKYKLSTGTPTSGGAAEQQILADAVARIAAPMELEKVRQRYNILQGMSLPVEQGIGREGITYAGSFLPQVAGLDYSSATNLANSIQALKSQVAGMTLQNAQAFLAARGVPIEMQQRILSNNIAQLGQIGSAYPLAYYQGLNYLPGAPVEQQVYADMGLPGYPVSVPRMPTSTGTGGGFTPNLGSNAPVAVGGAGPGGVALGPQGWNGDYTSKAWADFVRQRNAPVVVGPTPNRYAPTYNPVPGYDPFSTEPMYPVPNFADVPANPYL